MKRQTDRIISTDQCSAEDIVIKAKCCIHERKKEGLLYLLLESSTTFQ